LAVVAAIDETFAISIAVPDALSYDLLSSWPKLIAVLFAQARVHVRSVFVIVRTVWQSFFCASGSIMRKHQLPPNLRVNSSCVDLAPSYVSP